MPFQAEIQLDANPLPALGELPFQRWLDTCFADRDERSVVIRITDAAESATLNAQYRGKSGPTNVLSFPFEAPPGIPIAHLGDLVICAEVVASESSEQGKPSHDHLAHLVVHGVLHLLGYDHIDDTEAQVMEALEVALLARIGVPDPYRGDS
ncbi:MAG: rRNA maturation RNase YbeY [Thiotrichales bacterium]